MRTETTTETTMESTGMRPLVNIRRFLAAATFGVVPGTALAAWDLNMPRGVTPISAEAYDLHMLILWICVVIGVVVFGAMFYSMIMHRKSTGRTAAQFHHSTFAEICWTIVPFLILVGMAVPATQALINIEDTSEADLTLKVTGYQWKWRYDYIEDGVTLYSNLAPSSRAAIYGDPKSVDNYLLEVDEPVVIPVNKKIRVLLTSDDVIHAWWVPVFGLKKDAIPGFINEIWVKVEEPGTYRGQCAELCGKDHGFMPIVVKAVDENAYQQWVAEFKQERATHVAEAARDWPHSELLTKGEQVYTTACATCHQLDGNGVVNVFPPIAGSEVAIGDVKDHLKLILEGREGTAMRGFATQLTDVELAAVATYQRNAFGNETGDTVQPSQIIQIRQQL